MCDCGGLRVTFHRTRKMQLAALCILFVAGMTSARPLFESRAPRSVAWPWGLGARPWARPATPYWRLPPLAPQASPSWLSEARSWAPRTTTARPDDFRSWVQRGGPVFDMVESVNSNARPAVQIHRPATPRLPAALPSLAAPPPTHHHYRPDMTTGNAAPMFEQNLVSYSTPMLWIFRPLKQQPWETQMTVSAPGLSSRDALGAALVREQTTLPPYTELLLTRSQNIVDWSTLPPLTSTIQFSTTPDVTEDVFSTPSNRFGSVVTFTDLSPVVPTTNFEMSTLGFHQDVGGTSYAPTYAPTNVPTDLPSTSTAGGSTWLPASFFYTNTAPSDHTIGSTFPELPISTPSNRQGTQEVTTVYLDKTTMSATTVELTEANQQPSPPVTISLPTEAPTLPSDTTTAAHSTTTQVLDVVEIEINADQEIPGSVTQRADGTAQPFPQTTAEAETEFPVAETTVGAGTAGTSLEYSYSSSTAPPGEAETSTAFSTTTPEAPHTTEIVGERSVEESSTALSSEGTHPTEASTWPLTEEIALTGSTYTTSDDFSTPTPTTLAGPYSADWPTTSAGASSSDIDSNLLHGDDISPGVTVTTESHDLEGASVATPPVERSTSPELTTDVFTRGPPSNERAETSTRSALTTVTAISTPLWVTQTPSTSQEVKDYNYYDGMAFDDSSFPDTRVSYPNEDEYGGEPDYLSDLGNRQRLPLKPPAVSDTKGFEIASLVREPSPKPPAGWTHRRSDVLIEDDDHEDDESNDVGAGQDEAALFSSGDTFEGQMLRRMIPLVVRQLRAGSVAEQDVDRLRYIFGPLWPEVERLTRMQWPSQMDSGNLERLRYRRSDPALGDTAAEDYDFEEDYDEYQLDNSDDEVTGREATPPVWAAPSQRPTTASDVDRNAQDYDYE